MAELGYPAYFVTILGAWKVLGGLAILAPRLPRLIVLLGIAAASWALRPASLKLGAGNGGGVL